MGILHDIGQVGGHVLNAAPGYSTLGANITNPDVNYKGVLNPPTPSNNFLGNPPGGNTTKNNNSRTKPSGSDVYSGGAAPAGPTAEQLASIQQQTGVINNALGRLPNQLDIAKGNIQGQYNTNLNELNSGEQQAQGQYNQSTGQNQQDYVANKNSITDQAAAGLHSLLRILGMHGAGGSSDYQFAAPQAVATQAAQQRSGAGQTYGQNQQNLDTNWNGYETGVGQSKQKLNDWLTQQNNSAQSQSDTARASLLQSLAGLQPSVAGAQPFIDQVNGLNNQVDELGRLNPTYTGTAPTYTAPTVASYSVNPAAPVQQQNSALDSTTSPFLAMLGLQKDKQQQPSFGF